MTARTSRRTLLGLCAGALLAAPAAAQPTVRTLKSYEDTVRILVLSNLEAKGKCDGPTGPVGEKTRDFLLQSLAGIPNVASRDADGFTWDSVARVWPGRMPHVIVHVNAGWQSRSGPALAQIMDLAAAAQVGVVSIGDDAAAFADQTFGFHDVENQPQPMGDARQYDGPGASLWIDLDGAGDTLAAGGILRNTVTALGATRLAFHPVEPDSADPAGKYRCQADADKYAVEADYAGRVTFLGFQRAFDGTDTVGGPRELQVIAAFQDKARRGVALSYQPQFLADARAAHQINYDAIIYASYAHAHGTPIKPDPPKTDPPKTDPPKIDPAKPPDVIRSVAAFPPVSGDVRPQVWAGLLGGPAGPLGPEGPQWIPPVGFVEAGGYREHPLPVLGQPAVGADAEVLRGIPRNHALVQVVGRGRYLARVTIVDHLGNAVRSFRQSFGYRGELDNPRRVTPLGLQSFLVWDLKDDRGALAGQGVYLWRIDLVQEKGPRVGKVIRMGLLRP